MGLHGSGLIVFHTGILLLGDSGVGKTDTVLEFLRYEHMVISDDMVYFELYNNSVIMYSKNPVVLHVRGVGFINASVLYPLQICNKFKLSIVIELISDINNSHDSDITICNIVFPIYKIHNSRNIVSISELLVRNDKTILE